MNALLGRLLCLLGLHRWEPRPFCAHDHQIFERRRCRRCSAKQERGTFRFCWQQEGELVEGRPDA
jgi:hypothetical protein